MFGLRLVASAIYHTPRYGGNQRSIESHTCPTIALTTQRFSGSSRMLAWAMRTLRTGPLNQRIHMHRAQRAVHDFHIEWTQRVFNCPH